MIGSLERKYVFLTPAKTGATGWRSWLAEHCNGIQINNAHSWQVPIEYRQCTPYLSVRNPYDRCISLWWYSCADPAREKKCHLYGCSFVKYMHRLMWFRDHPDEGHAVPFAYMSLAQYGDRVEKQMGKQPNAIHLESWEADVASFGLATEQETTGYRAKNTSTTRPPVSPYKFLSGLEEELVWQYCQEDFHRFGYARLPREMGGLRRW